MSDLSGATINGYGALPQDAVRNYWESYQNVYIKGLPEVVLPCYFR